MKTFFAKDKTGRGYSAELPEERFRKSWDLEETDFNGKSLEEFIDHCEVGDEWENASDKIICIVIAE